MTKPQSRKHRLVIAGGGTGGHLFPGIALVEEFRRRDVLEDVLFIGSERGIEARVIPQRGEQFHALDVRPLKGRDRTETIKNALLLPKAVADAIRVLREFKPTLVVGVGGYAAGPTALAAAALGIKTAVLEQNAQVGGTNRLLASVVGRAYVSFAETSSVFGKKARELGNPVRRVLTELANTAVADPQGFDARGRTILVMGGSQGSHLLNESVPRALAGMDLKGLTVLHQSGQKDEAIVRDAYASAGVVADVVPFIDDVARAYADAALVVGRSGATTVAELTAVGRAAVFVPFAKAADDHQRKNAETLAARGAARVVLEANVDTELAAAIEALVSNRSLRNEMHETARSLGRPDAAQAIVDDLLDWCGGGDSQRSVDGAGAPSSIRTGALDNERPPSPRDDDASSSSAPCEPRRRRSRVRRERLVVPNLESIDLCDDGPSSAVA